MRISKPVNSLSVHVIFDDVDLAVDHQKRFYSVPKDYRREGNPYDNEPYCAFHAEEIESSQEAKEYEELMRLAANQYWKILADDAEDCYARHN